MSPISRLTAAVVPDRYVGCIAGDRARSFGLGREREPTNLGWVLGLLTGARTRGGSSLAAVQRKRRPRGGAWRSMDPMQNEHGISCVALQALTLVTSDARKSNSRWCRRRDRRPTIPREPPSRRRRARNSPKRSTESVTETSRSVLMVSARYMDGSLLDSRHEFRSGQTTVTCPSVRTKWERSRLGSGVCHSTVHFRSKSAVPTLGVLFTDSRTSGDPLDRFGRGGASETRGSECCSPIHSSPHNDARSL